MYKEDIDTVIKLLQDVKNGATLYARNKCLSGGTWYKHPNEKIREAFGFNLTHYEYKTEFPKLDQSVFDREDCPEWAEYATISKSGICYVYSKNPRIVPFGYSKTWLSGLFDTSDWEHSFIERKPKTVKVSKDDVFKFLKEKFGAKVEITE